MIADPYCATPTAMQNRAENSVDRIHVAEGDTSPATGLPHP